MVSATIVQRDAHESRAEGAASPPAPSLRRWLPPEALPSAFFLAVAAVLVATGYPGWRVAALAAAAIVPPIGFYLASCGRTSWGDPRNCVNADAGQIARWPSCPSSRSSRGPR